MRASITLNLNLRKLSLTGMALLLALLTACSSGTTVIGSGRAVRIAILNVNNATEQTRVAFIDGMKALGYDEEKGTAKIIWKGEAGTTDSAKIQEKIALLLDDKPDILFVMNTAIAVAASKMNLSIPVVFAAVYDPVGAGVVADRVRPGKNITGIAHGISEPKRLEWYIKIAPRARQLYVPYNPRDSSAVASLNDIKATAEKLRLRIIDRPCTTAAAPTGCTADEVKAVIRDVPPDADGFLFAADPLLVGQIALITEVSIAKKLPVSVIGHPDVEAGALFSYGFNFRKIGPQAARIANQILKGVKPSDIPIETAELDLFINLVTANKIGLTVSREALLSANTLIRTAPNQPTQTTPPVGTLPATAAPVSTQLPATTVPPTIAPTVTAAPTLAASPTIAVTATADSA